MSSLTYGGLTIDTLKTTSFTQEAVYDPSNVDLLYTKIMISVRGVINAATSPAAPGEPPAQTVVRMRKAMLKPRQQLIFTVGADTLVRSPADGVSEDPKHGPFPKHCNIISITEATFMIDFTVETYIIDTCDGATTPYISNKWEENISIDQDQYTKRTIKGQVIFRADLINDKVFNNGLSPDAYRSTLIPPNLPLLPNFIRESLDFTVQTDGTALQYTIVDKEQYTIPPASMTRFTGEHVVTCTKGAIYLEQISIKAYGNAVTPKSALIANAVSFILGRLNAAGQKKIIKGGYIKDTLNENVVEVKVETFATARQQTIFGLNVAQPNNITNLDYVLGNRRSNLQPDPGMAGTAQLAMTVFSTYLTLCTSAPTLGDVELRNSPTGPTPNSVNTSLSTSAVGSLPSQSTLFTGGNELQNGIYTTYQIDIDYKLANNTIQMPYMNTNLTRCAIIPLGQSTMVKIVKFRAEKWGEAPSVPAALTTDSNSVCIFADFTPSNLDAAPDGQTPVYTCRGEYIYALYDPTLENINGGIAPYLALNYSDSAFTGFMNGLIDNAGTPELNGGPDIF